MNWISVEDSLPITNETLKGSYACVDVIMRLHDGEVEFGEYSAGDNGGSSFWGNFNCSYKVTHWMPKPKWDLS